jgi:AbiV family abortive infection protein
MDEKLFKLLAAGTQKVFENAIALYKEALILTEAGALSRALFLHQISMEECAKVEILGTAATGLLMGEAVSVKALGEAFRSHERKNRVNAYFLDPSLKERSAQMDGRLTDAVTAFKLVQDRFHARSNLDKNAALYVDLQKGEFKAPRDRITGKMVARIGKLNERFLHISADKVGLLQKWDSDSAKPGKLLKHFKKRLLELKGQYPKDPAKAFAKILGEMLEMAQKQRSEN